MMLRNWLRSERFPKTQTWFGVGMNGDGLSCFVAN